MESTFYGLPFYRVGTDPAPLPPAPVNEPVPDATGTDSVETTLQETTPAAPQSTSLGTYFAGTDEDGNEEIIVAPGRPIQPKDATDISVVDPDDADRTRRQEALGAIVLEMDSTYQVVDNPVIASPTFVGGASLPESTVASGRVPEPAGRDHDLDRARPARARRLVVATGQYNAGTQTQRLDTDIDVVVYYAGPRRDRPQGADDHRRRGDRRRLGTDRRSRPPRTPSGVSRAYLLVAEDPGDTPPEPAPTVWKGLDLRRIGTTDRWTGSLDLTRRHPARRVRRAGEGPCRQRRLRHQQGDQLRRARGTAATAPPPPPPPTELAGLRRGSRRHRVGTATPPRSASSTATTGVEYSHRRRRAR